MRAPGEHYAVAYPEWADKPFNFGDFRRGARFVNSLTNGKMLSKTQDSSADGFTYDTLRRATLARDRAGHVRHEPRDADTGASRRASSCRATTSGSRPPTTTPRAAAPTRTGRTRPVRSTRRTCRSWIPRPVTSPTRATQPLATYNPNDPNSSVDTPGSPPGAAPTWCPVAGRADLRPGLPARTSRRASTSRRSTWANVSTVGQAKTPVPLGHLRPGRQRRRDPRHARPAAAGLQLPAGLALLPRWRGQRAGLPGGDLGLRLLPR